MRILILIIGLHIAILPYCFSQPSQNIGGKIVDIESQQPLAHATVMILEAGPITGVTSDEDGIFNIEEVPVGRYNILISHTGYESFIMKEVLCESGKQVFLDVGMKEAVVELGEVMIANVSKDQTINPMAGVSARSFTVEETERYPGSWGDPSRMASNYAGVFINGDLFNHIVIRGNSPNGLIWRMEGIPIPNPNHFDYPGSKGGPISMINNKLLMQSDFLTGAFPAEYTNGLSGVFDLRMRNGNSQKHEFVAQLGLMGAEVGAEGPFSKKSKASYLINFRYSLLGLVDDLLWVDALPFYQDLSLKLNFPLKKGNLSVFGLAGASHITGKMDDTTTYTGNDVHELVEMSGSRTGVIGLKYVHFFSDRTRIISNLALSGSRSVERTDSLINGQKTRMIGEEDFKDYSLLFSSKLVKKFNARNVATIGLLLEDNKVDYLSMDRSILYRNPDGDSLVLLPARIAKEDHLMVFQSFMEWKHRFTNKLTLYTGLNYQHFFYNNSFAIEPRASLRWNFKENQSISIGYGLHSTLQAFFYYLVRTPLSGNLWDVEPYTETNQDLEFTKSHHFALGYDFSIQENLRLKAEVYYQSLYNVPVETKESYFSLINIGSGDEYSYVDSMVNDGTGRNAGIELTLEKFLSKHYYFLITTSLLDSKYEGSDGITRNTAFNTHYNLNALVGYELPLNDKSTLNFNIRTVAAGGRRVIPHDEEKTIEEGEDVYNSDEAYELQLADYFRLDARAGYKISGTRASHEIAVDLTNLTNRPNEFLRTYNATTKQIETRYQQGFFLYIFYRIRF